MKTLFNITTSEDDLQRYQDREDLQKMTADFDGVELMYFGEDRKQIIPREQVVGLHMHFFPYWLDFWNGNEPFLLKEFGKREVWERYYGGKDRNAILDRYRKDLETAKRYGVEYVVFHVSEATIEESFTWNYHHTDEEVVDAAAELLNELFSKEEQSMTLLLENLWQPGLNMTRPEITRRLFDRISFENKGIMLDTGHFLHTNPKLRTQEEGVAYLHQMLDAHGDLCRLIRGVHLHQSLTGEYCEEMMKNPPKMKTDYEERYTQMFFHAYATDRHEPFVCPGVKELVQRIAPEYLTLEFITTDRRQHREFLQRQLEALK